MPRAQKPLQYYAVAVFLFLAFIYGQWSDVMHLIKLFTLSALFVSLNACVATSHNSSNPTSVSHDNDTLSDAELINIAKQQNRQPQSHTSRSVIGVHHGVNVIEEFQCSDVCPENTMRVVHYDIDDAAQCSNVGGVVKSILTPIAIAVMPKDYCLPAVIADYWESYPAN